ncbi:hypothetical protein [Pseudovibrio sp. JE062]|uniref:hypothetical protein n=1 Tax=Pseudovibrio sp. JE062 TaxID=439495 RepID=UPI000186C773|nr:hypothetical protein [Pseudovibrio sp. JE062]EEA95121.1 hypothetical protein PJE062_2690 [Pseudovibrio sp. JE062]
MADAAKQIPHADSNDVPILIVFHKEGKEPARGSWYPADETDAARAACHEMELFSLEVKGPELQALAEQVPKGQVFSSGKLFMPRIKKSVYEGLCNLLPTKVTTPQLHIVAGSQAEEAAEKASQGDVTVDDDNGTIPKDWSKTGVGSPILAREHEEDCWYLAIILESLDANTFKLKWRDYPDEPIFTRQISQLGTLHPNVDVSELEWEWE